MPAMLDDPSSHPIYRRSGQEPFLTQASPLPPDFTPRQVTLRDRVTAATLVPFSNPHHVPPMLMAYLSGLLNREIESGDTYPMIDPIPLASFGPYWFANFGAVMLLGDARTVDEMLRDTSKTSWDNHCLGSFYIKPNYPGRSSHVCNGGFLVSDLARNRGVGRLMGEAYIDWAPKLGYTYSVFNLVYETNVASCRIWDALGFKRIGRVKGCGNLSSYPDRLIDAIQYGRDLAPEGEDITSPERFDKIRYYLSTGKYPTSADRAEKSRLRSAATHYRLVPGEGGDAAEEKLMLKDKEVISDPTRQYDIARAVHAESHAGINKSTAVIAERYHWSRIKEVVSLVIRNCTDCQKARADDVAANSTTMSSIAAPPPTSRQVLDAQSGGGVGEHGTLRPQNLEHHSFADPQWRGGVVQDVSSGSTFDATSLADGVDPSSSSATVGAGPVSDDEAYMAQRLDPRLMAGLYREVGVGNQQPQLQQQQPQHRRGYLEEQGQGEGDRTMDAHAAAMSGVSERGYGDRMFQ